MLNNISSLLFSIAGVSASFVAILGGCIAAKLISINQDRENCRNKLSEIRFKRLLFTEQRNMSKQLMDEADALNFINQHSEEFMDDYEKVQWQTADFQTRIKTFTGWPAQIIQHEIDHCDGILI